MHPACIYKKEMNEFFMKSFHHVCEDKCDNKLFLSILSYSDFNFQHVNMFWQLSVKLNFSCRDSWNWWKKFYYSFVFGLKIILLFICIWFKNYSIIHWHLI